MKLIQIMADDGKAEIMQVMAQLDGGESDEEEEDDEVVELNIKIPPPVVGKSYVYDPNNQQKKPPMKDAYVYDPRAAADRRDQRSEQRVAAMRAIEEPVVPKVAAEKPHPQSLKPITHPTPKVPAAQPVAVEKPHPFAAERMSEAPRRMPKRGGEGPKPIRAIGRARGAEGGDDLGGDGIEITML